MTIVSKAKEKFRISKTKEDVIFPPEQIFLNPDFTFLLTIGGNLVEDENEFQRLISLLKEFGETEFYILENIEYSSTERSIPFQATIPIDKDENYFQSIGKSFDPDFGYLPYNFFIFGNSNDWAIYQCECPTINIIGCKKEIAKKFADVYNIVDNGFAEQLDFISQEFELMGKHQNKNNLLDEFVGNYKF